MAVKDLTPAQKQQVNSLMNSNAVVRVNLPVHQLANLVYFMVTLRKNPMLPAMMMAFTTATAEQALDVLEGVSPGIKAIVAIVTEQYADG